MESLTEVLRLPLSRLIRWYWDSSMSPSVAGFSVHLHRDTDGSSRQDPSLHLYTISSPLCPKLATRRGQDCES